MNTAYVTGATGCIGRNLVDVLLADNWRVIALHRKTSDLARLDGCNVEFREVDLHDEESVRRSLGERADVLFHCAANVSHHPKDAKAQYLDNVLATENLVERFNGRFVYCSTGAVALCDGMSSEEVNRVRSGYIKTKTIAEDRVRTHPNHVILRPIIVVGPHDYNNYSRIFELLDHGRFPFSIPGKIEFCDARDVAKSHLAAYYSGTSGETYFLGGEYISWHDFLCLAAMLLNRRRPLRSPPIWAWKAIAKVQLRLERSGYSRAEFTPELIELLCTEPKPIPREEAEKSHRDLGYRSRPLVHSLIDAINFWRLRQPETQK